MHVFFQIYVCHEETHVAKKVSSVSIHILQDAKVEAVHRAPFEVVY